MAAHKGCKKTGGRQLGTKNKVPSEIKALAAVHGPEAIERLVKLMRDGAVGERLAACNALLDRGYGKPSQPHDGDGQGGAITFVVTTGVRGPDWKPPG